MKKRTKHLFFCCENEIFEIWPKENDLFGIREFEGISEALAWKEELRIGI